MRYVNHSFCSVPSSWNTGSHYLSNIIFILHTVKEWHPKRSNSRHFFIHIWGFNQSQCQWSIFWSSPAYQWEWYHAWQLAERHKRWHCGWFKCQSGGYNCTQSMREWTLSTSPWQWLQDENARQQFKGVQLSLSWWKSSAHRYINLGKLAVKYLGVPAMSAPSERIWSRAARVLTVKQNRMNQEATSAMIYCRENKHILHKYYTEIAKERMHEDDHHLIARHKALLPTFEDENDKDSESNIDVGV